MKKYAAIYGRKSKEKEESLSITFQIQRGINYCKDHNWEYKIYDCDEGFSAGNTRRPGYQQLMKDIEYGIIDKIIIYKFDRISRNLKDFSILADSLQKKGVSIISLVEQFDTTTAFGRAMVMQLMIFAQLEREQTSERIKDNAIDRMSLGRWYGGPIPLGYETKKEINNGKVHPILIINKDEAELVKKIYNEYLKPNSSTKTIAKQFNENNILMRNERILWKPHRISYILKQPIYCQNSASIYEYYKNNSEVQLKSPIESFDGKKGIILFGKIKQHLDGTRTKAEIKDNKLFIGEHDYIIDSKSWLEVQEKLNKNRFTTHSNIGRGKASILSGLVFCKCGSIMTIAGSKQIDANGYTYRYFKCINRDNTDNCKNENVRIYILEKFVEDELFKYINNEKILKDYIIRQNKLNNSKEYLTEEINKLNNSIIIIDNKISNLLSDFSENMVLKDYIEKEITKLDSNKKRS